MFSPKLAAPVLLAVSAATATEPAPDLSLEQSLKKVMEVYAVAESEAADPVPAARAFYEGAIPGMLRRLDPHSVFFDAGQFQQLKELEQSTRKGFGTVVSLLPGRVTILQTMPGSPSQRAGLLPGDEILAVNGIDLSRLEIEQLVQLLGQTRQQQARLDVHRPGSTRLIPFVLTPADVDSPSVERAWEIRPGIGYVRVGNFETQTGGQLRDALEKLGGTNLKGLVLDLRNNPGGVITAAFDTVSLFLKPGEKILSVKGRAFKGDEVSVPSTAKPYDFPIAILVNGKTASAAEIVTGALQDHKRATVIGEQTFGKGLVQSVFNLSQGTGLALTTAFYYTPSGRSIQRHLTGQLEAATSRSAEQGNGGIRPDQTVLPDPVTRLRAAMELSNSFATYATEYLQKHGPVKQPFELAPAIVDDFRGWLGDRRIQPGMSEWSRELPWVRFRLRQEILNQGVGVEAGDRVEADHDPIVLAGLGALGTK